MEGRVRFDGYSTRYREGLDLVLRDITCDIPGGQKVRRRRRRRRSRREMFMTPVLG